ncbi:GDP-mannose mannosyl hydrolase [Methylovirgula sp. HY1]|uniref:GDP-mannose mannosyl hydrolase n=1 Tax=Methylovirgula sp. HY1 TaxID=2822761 RepID=UPI001C5BA282|nr:GDP-mannose mannosyl hydrolase [Methylovirgula sp. HY1]QXX73954.1 GDP-mannose mannosyl hydrolase [Methylovirgula sp. HY1]
MAAGFLPDDDFAHIVRYAPLVSIDLILKDPDDRVLLGLRMNEPAKGRFFVPGGVIRKNETIEAAYARILQAETGLAIPFDQAKCLGAYQHFYPTNRFGDPAYGTHYVVLAHELKLAERPKIELDSQHSHIRWMSGAEILAAPNVHENTQAYFRPSA